MYCTNVHSYFEKGNKYISVSTHKSQCFKEVYEFMYGHNHCSTRPHAARWPRLDSPDLDEELTDFANIERLWKRYWVRKNTHLEEGRLANVQFLFILACFIDIP